jgi:signal transduction histidine kinase/ligand-binding sensor domain-containing protein
VVFCDQHTNDVERAGHHDSIGESRRRAAVEPRTGPDDGGYENLSATLESVIFPIVSRLFGISRRATTVVLAWVCIALALPALAHGLDATPEPQQVLRARTLGSYHHTAFLKQSGGGVGGVIGMAQTDDGFLWMSTSSKGLARFDGKSFVMFTPAPGEQLPAAQLDSMSGAEGGGLWFSSSAGATLLKDGHLTTFGEKQGYLGAEGAFEKGPDGGVWSATRTALMKFVGGQWRVVYKPSRGHGLTDTSIDDDGNVWTLSSGRLGVIPRGDRTPSEVDVGIGKPTSVTAAKSGHVYVTDADHVFFFKRMGTTLEPVAQPIAIKAFTSVEGVDGAVWFASVSDGAFLISREELAAAEADHRVPHAERFSQADGLTSNFAPTILRDSEGDIWLGTNFGIDRFRPVRFTSVPLPAGTNGVTSALDGSGNLWIGSENFPVQFEPVRGNMVETSAPIHNMATFSDLHDGSAWAAGPKGISQLLPEGPALTQSFAEHKITGGTVTPCMLRAGDGTFYICQSANAGGNVMMSAGGAWRPVFDQAINPMTLAEDTSDNVWVGGRQPDRLYRTRGGTVTGTYNEEQGLAVGQVRSIFPAANGLWVGGDDGLQWYDGTRFRSLHLANPDLGRPVSGVVVDGAGNLWFQTLDGILRLPAEAVTRSLTDDSYAARPELFNEEDGIVGPPMLNWTHPSLRLDGFGRVWAQSKDGLAWTDPNRLQAPAERPLVLLDGMDASGQELFDFSRNVRLQPDQRSVRIRYTSPSPDGARVLTFRYRLVGAGAAWQDVGERREATFTNLAPGHYRFEVLAVGPDGRASDHPAFLTFEREAAYYEMWWFKLLWAVPLLLTVWLLYELRARAIAGQMRIRVSERESVARLIHDTLLQRVQSLNMTLGRLVDDETIPSAPRDLLVFATLESKRAVAEGRDQIASLRAETDVGLAFYDQLALKGSLLEKETGIAFTIRAVGRPKPLKNHAAAEVRDVALEAVRNAFAHAKASRVNVTLSYEERAFWLIVSDDGVGIARGTAEQARRNGHFGIAGMRERVAELRAQLKIDSSPGEGTEIHVSVPARVAYASRDFHLFGRP